MIRTIMMLGAATLAAAAAAGAQDSLSMTLYDGGQTLVTDRRALSFEAGEQTIQLPGVSSMIVAPSVGFAAEGVTIVEQNYDFDLLSPMALMQKSVGETVTLVSVNPGTGRETRRRAKILAVNGGVVVESGGKIEVLRDDGIPTRVIFERVPPNLRAQPTLSVTVDSEARGTRPATLTYLTGGLSWQADYVARFDKASGTMDLQGWATIVNSTETNFQDADLKLVAGQTNREDRYGDPRRARPNVRRGGVTVADQERLGDYYLYRLPGRSTVAPNQTKQIGLVDADGVPAERRYEHQAYGFETSRDVRNVDVRIAMTTGDGFGEPLPAGTVRVYQSDARGQSLFVGEDRVGHVPAGSLVSLKIGQAFDLTVKPTVTDRQERGRWITDTTMSYLVANASPTDETVTVVQNTWAGCEKTIRRESLKSKQLSEDSFAWDVPVPSGGETTLTFTLRTDCD